MASLLDRTHARHLMTALLGASLVASSGCATFDKRSEAAGNVVHTLGSGDKRTTTNSYIDFRVLMDRPFSPGRKAEIRSLLDQMSGGFREWRIATSRCEQVDGLADAVGAMGKIDEFERFEARAVEVLNDERADLEVQIRFGLEAVADTPADKNAVAAEKRLMTLDVVCEKDPRIVEQDVAIEAEPRFNVEGDLLVLPSASTQRLVLFEDLRVQVMRALESEVSSYWKVKVAAAKELQSMRARQDLLAEVWVMTNLQNSKMPTAQAEAQRIAETMLASLN